MTVCITGMHRSGTSLVARLLNLCGLYLGPEERLLPADEGNPAGYWQNLDIDRISEDILAHFSEGWDFLLPPLPPDWENQPGLNPHREQAQKLIKLMDRQKPWGWKDPRCSLALPFWKSIVPGLKVVVCIRHPIETVNSLKHHTGGTDAFSYNLWLRYYQHILADTAPTERLITHYDMYFVDPQGELRRITRWLGLPVDSERIQAACGAVLPSVRRHRLSEQDQDAARVPVEVVELYQALCDDGGQLLREAILRGHIPPLNPSETIDYRLPTSDTTPQDLKVEAQAAFERAHQLIERNRFDDALTALQQAVSLHPFHAPAQNDLGVLYLTKGLHDKALAHLSIAHQLDPDNADPAKNLADVYLQLGRAEDMIQTLLDLIHYHPHDVEALSWLATACLSQGQKDEAVQLFSRVLELQPDHAGAQEALQSLKESPSQN